jgi:hypothetical protein
VQIGANAAIVAGVPRACHVAQPLPGPRPDAETQRDGVRFASYE